MLHRMTERKKCRKRDCEEVRFGRLSLCRNHYKSRKRSKSEKDWYIRFTSDSRRFLDQRASKLKIEALEAYGNQCHNCGTDESSQLQLDHIEDNGLKPRLLISKGRAGSHFYRALKNLGWPNKEPYTMEVVCFDCHTTRTQKRRYQ